MQSQGHGRAGRAFHVGPYMNCPQPVIQTTDPENHREHREGACRGAHRHSAGPDDHLPQGTIKRAARRWQTYRLGRGPWLAWAGGHGGTGWRQHGGKTHCRLWEMLLEEWRVGRGRDGAHRQARLQTEGATLSHCPQSSHPHTQPPLGTVPRG
jgi:hypothetical protein